MLRATGLTAILLLAGCDGGRTAAPQGEIPPELRRYLAEQELRSTEDTIRLSVYHSCGGDGELRCQQFAPEILRGIEPTIPLQALRCQENGDYPRRVRACTFRLGKEGGSATDCRVTLHETPGPHSLYWSDQVTPEPRPEPAGASVPDTPLPRSSLVCAGPLFALTARPEAVDPSPATPPIATTALSGLISPDDVSPPFASAAEAKGPTGVRLQVGSHGRIDRCRVVRSSGLERLDEQLCDLLRTRAHFQPARDRQGRAVASEIPYSQVWAIQR